MKPQPHYAGCRFHQADALTFPLGGFDAIHASPPCQAYSIMRNLPWLRGKEYWDSIPPTRAILDTATVPWVMENVGGAPLDGIFLCGTMFDLRQPDGGPEYRHRLFEASFFMLAPGHPKHCEAVVPGPHLKNRQNRMSGIGGMPWAHTGIDRAIAGHGFANARQNWGRAMGIDWMSAKELAQAIPPAYTEFIGAQLLRALA